jgi:RimJ/RimL family protein N-acetyltransferase
VPFSFGASVWFAAPFLIRGSGMIAMIKTERLVLRGMVRQDFPAFAAMWREPEVVRFISGAAVPEAESWAAFLRNAGNWAIEGFGQWGIFRRSDDAFLGQTGFFTPRRDLGADFDGMPEVGWVLTAAAQGQGFGREATEAAHRWFDVQPFGGLSGAIIVPEHAVSLGLAGRLGYRSLRESLFRGDPIRLLVRRRAG